MAAPRSIAILDDYGNIASSYFSHIPNLKVATFPETLNPENPADLQTLVSRLEPFPIISTMRERTPFQANLLSQLPNLKLLLTTGMRNASLDIPTASSRGIVIAGTTGAGTATHPKHLPDSPTPAGYDSTTQHTWALILSIANNTPRDDYVLKNTSGFQSGYTTGLAGKTLGIVGLGRLGARTARIGVAGFGMNVVAWSANLTQEKADEEAERAGLPKGSFRVVTKEQLFSTADFVSLHYVLSPRSTGIVTAADLGLMKPSAFLINTARAKLVIEADLLKVLKEGKIKGAALDVFWTEPLPKDSEWRSTKWGEDGKSHVVLSPHMGYVEEQNIAKWYEEQAENVENWIAGGEIKNKIN